MKHPWKITIILLAMFLVAQFIGLYVINQYSERGSLPGAFQVPEPETQKDFWFYFAQIIPAFAIAIFIVILITKYKWKFFMKTWFFIVIFIALALAFGAFFKAVNYDYKIFGFSSIALILALIFAIIKIYRPTILVHNFTELLIYPGIAAVFVPILNVLTIVVLLIIISAYDMWAVWHSGIMQKMAKFQMEELRIFGGFLVPHMTKKLKTKLKKLKKLPKSKQKNKKFKVGIAILGGGDVVFPIIAAGVFLRFFGLIPALFVTAGALAGLTFLLAFSQKKKFYPAMPFITSGIFLGMLLAWLLVI